MAAYARAREKALCVSNILSSFYGAGLVPFCPNKVLGRVPEPQTLNLQRHSTPDATISPLKHPLLTSSPVDFELFRSANKELKHRIATNSLMLEERNHINRLARSSEKYFTRTNLREEENNSLREVLHSRQNRKAGKSGILKGKYYVTKAAIYADLAQSKREAEEKAKAPKKLHGWPRKSQPLPTDPLIHPSILDTDMEVLNSEDEHSCMED